MDQHAPTMALEGVPFSVPFLHRLVFTTDVFGDDQDLLLDTLEPSGDEAPRVQFWIDDRVARARPGLPGRIRSMMEGAEASGRARMAGPVHTTTGGEGVKDGFKYIWNMLESFNEADLDRRSYVVVIGGGAVLDAVGFAAAIAHRGIRLVRLPTTTLAQADSGVGVKNSVNFFGKKNWVGTFAVPWAVINDRALLETLPDRDFACGFAEAVKVSLLKDAEIFDRICRDASRIRTRDMDAAWPMIQASVQLHLDHITRGGDPFEALEARPLDFGHWSAHKLEPMSRFELRHGEAVAIGVAVDTFYSHLVHGCPREVADHTIRCLDDLGLTLDHPALHQTEELMGGLEEFRQHLGGRLTVTMLQDAGDPIDVHEIEPDAMLAAIEHVSRHVKQRQAGSSADR